MPSSVATNPRQQTRVRNALKAGVAGATTAALAVVATRGTPAWEESVFDVLHDVPRWVDHALWAPMQFGSAWAPPAAAAVGWLATKSWRPTAGSLVVGWGGWWLAKGVKDFVDRGRPFEELGLDAVRSSAITEGLGFVSGHATVAFGCAAVLSPYLSLRWRVFVYTLAVVVGLSRIVVGAHLPLDAIGGAALGLFLAYLWHAAVGVKVSSESDAPR
jgi:membrane-associated phospholipid phosphatase